MFRLVLISAVVLLLGAVPAQAAVDLSPCDDPPDTLCGSIDVPLDRAHPGAGTIPIFFALVKHSAPGPAAGTILASHGGPGVSTTGEAGFFRFLFEPLLDRRDLLLIDLRGTGRSGAIECDGLQHAIGDVVTALRACGKQLGAASSLYGSGDRADDIEAVRNALGIERFDYYGLSGGGLQVQAYAARYGSRLRTAVLEAPYRAGFDDAFQSPVADALVRSAVLVCKRSPSCRANDRDPERTLRGLLEQVRRAPVSGTAPDSDGHPHRVVVDEARVIDLLADTSGGYLDHSEISAAARALERGDEAPLLRLAAEIDFPAFVDQGDPRFYSDGDYVATFCTDGVFPFSPTASEPVRRSQYETAIARLPRNAFAPFTVSGWMGSRVPVADTCVPWPAAPARAAVPPGATFPAVPALAVAGDLDVSVPSSAVGAVAARFPRAQMVEVAGVGHVPSFRSSCARELIVRFIETAAPVDASCAARFNPAYGVGRFVRRAAEADAPPADRGDRSCVLDRRVVAMAWAAAYDAIQRSSRMSGEGSGVGLRGGTFTTDFNAFTYDRVRFASDVAVSGSGHVDWDSGEVTLDLTIDGPGREDGTLHIEGKAFPHTESLRARGAIGGRRVAVLLPTA
jgi:pimeloyl-ACP methyl ester carboxylesterase